MGIVLKKEQQRTYDDIMNVLDKYGICSVERSFGFGKTYIIRKIVEDHPDKKCIIVEHSRAMANNLEMEMNYPSNVVMSIYAHLCREELFAKFREELEHTKDGFLLFDEAHKCGARKIKLVWKIILEICKKNNIKIIGLTGSPVRTDGYNVTAEMFGEHTVYEYGLDDLVQDKGIFMPDYFRCASYVDEGTMKELKRYLSSQEVNIVEKCNNMGFLAKEALENSGIKQDYYKFFVFYSTINDAEDGVNELRKQFEEQFPGFGIRVDTVHSKRDHSDNDEVMETMKYKPNTVDIITSINILNEGFHPDDLTGVILMRKTKSALVFCQQIGRAFTDNENHKMIVIDFVCNVDEQYNFGTTSASKSDNIVTGITRNRRPVEYHIKDTLPSVVEAENVLKKLRLVQTHRLAKNIMTMMRVYRAKPNIDIISFGKMNGFTEEQLFKQLMMDDYLRDEDRLDRVPQSYKDENEGIMNAWLEYYKDRMRKRISA